MKVMQLRMDEATYGKVEKQAILECKSMTAVVTDALSQHFNSQDDGAGLNGRNARTSAAPAKRAPI